MFARSDGIGDSSISAIASGCRDLEMINIAYCKSITDCSLMSLSKCSKLNTLESRGCLLITPVGLEAIAMGCKQLSKLDIKKCHNIDDAGMISLARFSQNLKQVLTPFPSRISHKKLHLRPLSMQINFSYTSVTDVGLVSLASISCLQSMTVLHVRGLTPRGLVAALLACGGLTKVKLQASFRTSLPELLVKHLEARGCTFLWRDKVFQVTMVSLVSLSL